MADLQLTLRIRANADGTAQIINGVGNSINRVSDQANQATSASARMAAALQRVGHYGAVAFAGSWFSGKAKEAILLADQMTLLDSRIKIASSSLQNYQNASASLTAIALSTGSSLESNVTLFSRLNKAVEGMGATYQTTLGITKTLAEGLKISGASAGEANSVMIQLSQALSSGVLRGDEFNSIMENGSRIVDALSTATGKSRGELRKMAEEGELSAKLVVDALKSQAASIHNDFGKIPLTIGAAMENVNTRFAKFIEHENNAVGLTSNLAKGLDEASQHIGLLAGALGGLTTLAVAIGGANLAMVAFNATTRLNPIIMAASVVAAGIGMIAGRIQDLNAAWENKITASSTLDEQNKKIHDQIQLLAELKTHHGLYYDTKIAKETNALKIMIAERNQMMDLAANAEKEAVETTEKRLKSEEKLNQILEGKYKNIITQAAEAYKVDQNLMLAIAQRESGSGKNMGRSSTGDWGLMQINENTAPQISNALKVSVNKILTDPETNAKASAWYVSWLQQQFSKANVTPTAELFAAAYNGGFGNLEKANFNLVNLKKTVREYAMDVADTQQALTKMSGTDWFKTQAEGAKQASDASKKYALEIQKLNDAAITGAQLYNQTIARLDEQHQSGLSDAAYAKGIEDANSALMQFVDSLDATKMHAADIKNEYEDWIKIFELAKSYQENALTNTERQAQEINKLVAVYNSVANTGNGLMSVDVFSTNLEKIQGKYAPSNLKGLEDYNTLIQKITSSTGQLGATNNAVFDSALGGINTLVSAFNNMSAAIDANTQSQLDLNAAKAGALADIRTSKDDEFGKAIKEKKALYDFDMASKKLADEKNQNELSGVRQIIGATAQMFDKKSNAAKALHGIEMGIAAAELTMKAQSIASNIAATTSGVVAGAAKFFAQSGWAAFAGIAAMIGVIGALGGTTSSPSMPSIDTKTQGTVLGDKTKSSNTAENLGKIMEDIHASEYLALLNINESIKKLNDSILAAVTGIFQRGDLATPTLPANTSSMFVNTRNEISQNRLTGKGNTLGAISDGWQFDLSQFIETKRTKDLLFGHMVKTSTSQNAVSDQTNRDVTAIYKNSGDMLIEAGKIFGMDVKDVVNAIRIPDLDIDIKDMTGEEAIKAFNAYISTSIDQMAGQVFPELAQYQKIGEGLGETVGRVAADVGIVKSVFDNLHVTLPTTAVGLIAVSEALVLAADGTDKLTTNLNNFYNKFYSDTEQALDNFHFLTQNFARKGIELPTDRLGYRDAARNALAKAGTDSDILAAAKTRLDELTKAAFAPFEKNLEIRKNNAERYGGEDARLYKIAQDEAKAAVKAATKSQADYVAELQKSSNASAENANLLLEQSDNADAYYSAIEKGQKALDPRPFRTSVNAFQHEFSKVSNQAIPTSIEGYRNLINSIDTSTEAGRRMHDGLVMLAPDFVDLDDSLSGLKDELSQVYVGGNDFTMTIISMADAFGSADKAAQVFKDSIKLVYSGNDVKTMSITAANTRFSNNAKAAGLEGLRVQDAQTGLKWITDSEIKGTINLGDKVKIGNGTYSWAEVQTWLVDNLNPIYNAENMSTGDNSASKAADDAAKKAADDAAKKAADNAKTLLDLNNDIAKQLKSIGLSDIKKSILDINTGIDDMITKAREAGGTLPAIESLRTAKLTELATQTFKDPLKQVSRIGNSDIQNQVLDIAESNKTLRDSAKALADASPALKKFFGTTMEGINALEKSQLQNVFKDVAQEFLDIGKIDYQKNLDGINQWADDMIKVAPSIAKAYDISTDDAIKGIQAISNARIEALNKERIEIMKTSEVSYRKALIQSSSAVSGNLELQLIDIKDQFTNTILNVIEKGGDLNDVAVQIRYAIETGTLAYQAASKEIQKAADEIFKTLKTKGNELADQIYKLKNPNDEAGLFQIQYQRELSKYMQGNYQDQIEAINTVQSLAMARYDSELTAINKIYDASKAINKYLNDLKLNERLSLNTNKQIVDESKAQFATQLAAAKAGDATALSEITTYADKYLNSSRDFYGVSQDYAAIRDSVTASLAALGVTDKVTFDQQTATATTKTVALLQDLQWAVNNTTQLQTNQLHNDLEALGSVTAQIGKAFTDSMYDLATKYQISNQQLLDAVNQVYDATSKTTASSGVPSTPSPASSGDVMSTFYSKVDSGDWLGAARYAFSVGGTKHDIATAIAARGGSYGETMNWLVMQGFATGGNYPGGLALVGEQGPEIINFRNPGQVYTAPQTRELMRGDNGELIAAIKANAKVIADEIIRLTKVNVEGQSELIAINEEQREEIARLRKEMARAALKA